MGNKSTKNIEIHTKDSEPGSDFGIPDTDSQLFKTIGFDVQDLVGCGQFGSVFRGVYRHIASGIRDTEDQLLDVSEGQEFAVKYIDVKRREGFEINNLRLEIMERIRKFVETEKRMQQKLFHSDLLQVNICLNLGEYQTICLNDSSKPIGLADIDVSTCYDRLYLFMDFSILGNLDKYLLDLSSQGLKVTEIEAKIWCQRLLSAIDYLHESNVFDVNIKPQNILMFEEFIETEDQTYVVPKISDFYLNNYFKVQSKDRDNSIDSDENSSDSEDSEEEKEVKYSEKELSQMADIFLLADVFDTVITKTEFKSESNRVLAKDLIESMRNFDEKRCDQFIQNPWFQSKEVFEKEIPSDGLSETQ